MEGKLATKATNAGEAAFKISSSVLVEPPPTNFTVGVDSELEIAGTTAAGALERNPLPPVKLYLRKNKSQN